MSCLIFFDGCLLENDGCLTDDLSCCCDTGCCPCDPKCLKAEITQISGIECPDSILGYITTTIDMTFSDDQDCPKEWKQDLPSPFVLDRGFIELELACDDIDVYSLKDIDSGGAFNILNDFSEGFTFISAECNPFRLVFQGLAAHEQGCNDVDNEFGPYLFEVVITERTC